LSYRHPAAFEGYEESTVASPALLTFLSSGEPFSQMRTRWGSRPRLRKPGCISGELVLKAADVEFCGDNSIRHRPP
jgi:hypothetical protein